jgi:hypothetical protein
MRRRLGTLAAIIGAALFAVFFISGGPALATSTGAQLEGSWMGIVEATAPPTGSSFTNLITFTPQGGVIESRRVYVPESAFGPILETTGHGEWISVGDREFEVNFIFLLQGAPDHEVARGELLGTDNIRMRLELNEEGTMLGGTFESTVKGLDGNVISTVAGNYTARPTHVESYLDPCATMLCAPDSHCVVLESYPPQARCVPKVDRCASIRCAQGTHCEVRQVQCVRAPCPPLPQCIPDIALDLSGDMIQPFTFTSPPSASLLTHRPKRPRPSGLEKCGNNICGKGKYCCNASCGICAPKGGFCIQIACKE